DLVEGSLGAVELDLAAPDAREHRFQCPRQAAQRWVSRHDLDQGGCLLKLAGETGDLLLGQEQEGVLFKELARTKRQHRLEVLLVAGELLVERRTRTGRQFGGWPLDDGQNRAVAVKGLVKLDVTLAPIQIGRNQRVDVGVDFKMFGSIKARPHRKGEGYQNSRGSKPRASRNNRNN